MELLVTRHQTESLPTLVVCALPEEAAHLGSGVLVTGPGKVRASVALTHALASQRPDQVIVCGTAGALDPSLHGVLEVGRVTEHDLDTTAISAVVGTDYGRTLQLSDSGHHLATATSSSAVIGPKPYASVGSNSWRWRDRVRYGGA